MLDDSPLCEDQQCPYVFVQSGCSPPICRKADLVRQKVGAIYVVTDGPDQFVGLLPGALSS